MFRLNIQVRWLCLLVLALCLVSGGVTCMAQRDAGVQLTGVVKDKAGNPLPNISVTIPGTNSVDTTDARGKFTLTRLTPGQITLQLNGNKGTGQVVLEVNANTAPQSFIYPVITKVIFLHINDLHGQIDNFPKLAAYAASVKKDNPNVFLVCAGDIFNGNPVIDQYSPKGYPIIALMNTVGFDAMVLGNHDFDYGEEVLAERMQDAIFPMLGANIKVIDGIISEPKPYINLITNNGLSIGVLGLTQVNSLSDIPDTNLANVSGIKFTDPFFTMANYEYLGNECAMLVALTHLGFEGDQQLAKQASSLDLIIGGHSHTEIDYPRHSGNALITQAQANLQFIGRVDVTLENGKATLIEGQLIDFDNLTEKDSEIQDMVEKFKQGPGLYRIIGTTPTPIVGKDELGSLITDAMCNIHQLDIAFLDNESIKLPSLQENITVDQIYGLDPSGSDIIRFGLTPAEIRTLIANSLRGKVIDLQVSGITYTVTLVNGEAKDVAILDNNGKPLDEDQIYQVGMNAFVAENYQFAHQDPGKSTFLSVAETLIQYIENGAALSYTGVQRTAIINE